MCVLVCVVLGGGCVMCVHTEPGVHSVCACTCGMLGGVGVWRVYTQSLGACACVCVYVGVWVWLHTSYLHIVCLCGGMWGVCDVCHTAWVHSVVLCVCVHVVCVRSVHGCRAGSTG